MADASGVAIEELKQWIGREEVLTDRVTVTPLRALAAILDYEKVTFVAGDPIPPCWQWLYFLPLQRQSEIASDGHARRGGFLPPVPLPRRMWAGSALEFRRPLRVGETVTRTSRIIDVSSKEGRTGALVFVKVRHEIGSDPANPAVVEDHDIVYREQTSAAVWKASGKASPGAAEWRREIHADEVLLFRFSAVTFNAHRIHYDRQYATQVEGYPDLVVHGPLTAMLLLDLLHRQVPGAQVTRFAFRGTAPLFANTPFAVCGRRGEDPGSVSLWAQSAEGTLAMTAMATLTASLD